VAQTRQTPVHGNPGGCQPRHVFSALADINLSGLGMSNIYAAICVAARWWSPDAITPACWSPRRSLRHRRPKSDSSRSGSRHWKRTAGGRDVRRRDRRRDRPADRTDLTTPNSGPNWRPGCRVDGRARGGQMSFSILVDKAGKKPFWCAQPVSATSERLRTRIRPGQGNRAGIVRQRGHQRRRFAARTSPPCGAGLLVQP